jgi:anti-sigma factor RsiW
MTRSDSIFDDQVLGSFVDGLLDAASSEKIIKAMEDDPAIRESIYQLRRAKDLMRLGFGDASPPSSHTVKAEFRYWKLFSPEIAASIAALVIAFGAGMLGHWYYDEATNKLADKAVASTSQHQPESE